MSRIAIAAALAALGSTALAQPASRVADSGYVRDTNNQVETGAFGQCVRTGYWNPALAADPCDPTATASVQPAARAQPEPVAQANPAPVPLAAAPRPVLEKVSLSSDVLFEFNKATLRPEGKEKLDELKTRIGDANVEEIVATGHADRIASENYNQKLSEERANAVKVYLIDAGMSPQMVRAEGKGESEPVTGGECRKMGPEKASNKKLVGCLQPDRRVDISVFGTRETSATGGTSGSGGSSR